MSTMTRGDQSVPVSTERVPLDPASRPADATPHPPSLLQRLLRAAPTLAIVAALAGIAVVGHSLDWTLPKFSALFGGASQGGENWCLAHHIAAAECIECNAALLPAEQDFGWCAVHGVSQCPLEHPAVAQLSSPFVVSPQRIEQARRALALAPRAENNSRCQLHARRIQFASIQAIEKSGIDIALVAERPLVETVTANGEVVYDQTRLAQLASRAPGAVHCVLREIGDRVAKGEVLALIDAAEVGKTKSDFEQALIQLRLKQATYERLQPLAANGSIARAQFREVEAALNEMKIRLLGAQQALVNFGLPLNIEDFDGLDAETIAERIRLLGIPKEVADQLDYESVSSNLLPLRSSLDGVVIQRDAVPGEVVDTTANLFTIADTSQMYLLVDVRQADARYLALDQTVLFETGERGGQSHVTGTIAWISTEVDDRTRTVKMRANLPNPDGRLRANTFGIARVVLREEPTAVVVPSEAIHWEGCCNVVFVRDKRYFDEDSPKFFHVRKVRPGFKSGEQTEIVAGLLPGEVVASTNSVVLAAQLLKSNLGAGCCEVPTPKK